MEINQNLLIEFADSIPRKASIERALITKSGLKFEDKPARQNFARSLDRWFCEHFGVKDSKDYVHVEGSSVIPRNSRGTPFFGAKMYPDAALITPDGAFKIAIELDHGKKGSQIRNALAKTSFSVVQGRYNRALVLFSLTHQNQLLILLKEAKRNEYWKYTENSSRQHYICSNAHGVKNAR